MIFAEYIWVDGVKPTSTLRSKTRILDLGVDEISIDKLPEWGFDGSSTNQALGDNSDCILKPVRYVKDPIRQDGAILVLCEVYDKSGVPHYSNTRFILRSVLDSGAENEDPLFGFEQEYTMFDINETPIGWPVSGYPKPQGPYYCGVGSSRIAGRELADVHMQACVDAGLLIFGVNAEVMLGQWEFQIGYRGFDEEIDALKIADHHWIALWLLDRLAEKFSIVISRENKPKTGDWNGAGCHMNFSTKSMRDKKNGHASIQTILKRLEQKHNDHIKVYGDKLEERLTGAHETCSIKEFRYGESDRGASIRIPVTTAKNGYGYLEDRRPGANIDPYLVSARLLVTICDLDDALLNVNSLKKELINS